MSTPSPIPDAGANPGSVTHPGQTVWMDYLYGETPRSKRRGLRRHLDLCPQCQAQVKAWRGTMTALDGWQVRQGRLLRRSVPTWLNWAAAACLAVGLGFLAGRYTSPAMPTVQSLRAAVAPSLESYLSKALEERLPTALREQWSTNVQQARLQLASEVLQQDREQMDRLGQALLAASRSDMQRQLARLALLYEQQRQQDYQTILASLRQLATRQSSDFTFLRKDLETLALTTETEIDRSRRQIGQLATLTGSPQAESHESTFSPARQPVSMPNP